jgi:hypothetical protein
MNLVASPTMRRREYRRRTPLCWLLLVLVMLHPYGARAQEAPVPVDLQIPLFLKTIAFDRQRDQRPHLELVMAVVYQGGFRASANTRAEVARAVQEAVNRGRHIRLTMIDLDRESLDESLALQHPTLVYFAPLRAVDISSLAAVAASTGATTVTGVAQYVLLGVAVGTKLQGDRPKLLINLDASRRCGADFTSELLKLAEVIR